VPLAAPAYALLGYIIIVAKFFAALPFATLTLPAFNALWLALAYALLFVGYAYIKKSDGGAVNGTATL